MLAEITPPNIRRHVCAGRERTKQMELETHSLFGHMPARIRLKFLASVKLSYLPPNVLQYMSRVYMTIEEPPWLTWGCINRLRTGTLAANNRGRNGTTSIETQHVHVGWPRKKRRICYEVPSYHPTAPWMAF